jgi:pimeloyl-ACP methyl ester carboxylesterase
MNTINDGTQIRCKDRGTGGPDSFSHGRPLNADAWEAQMFFPDSRGYRSVVHDLRGHGRPGQVWNGNDIQALCVWLSGPTPQNHQHHIAFGGEITQMNGLSINGVKGEIGCGVPH